MPVPKGKEKLYGETAGRMQNEGYSFEEAKNIADRAVKVKKSAKKSSSRKQKSSSMKQKQSADDVKLHSRKKF